MSDSRYQPHLGDKVRYIGTLLLTLVLVGCAVRKPAIKPGHDLAHPALTPLGKAFCKAGVLKVFNSYGWHNCKNEEPVPTNQPTPHACVNVKIPASIGKRSDGKYISMPERIETQCVVTDAGPSDGSLVEKVRNDAS